MKGAHPLFRVRVGHPPAIPSALPASLPI